MKWFLLLSLILLNSLSYSKASSPDLPDLFSRKPKRQHIKEKLTYEQFLELVKLGSAQIEELKPLWNWQNEMGLQGAEVYFGGGQLRMLLSFMNSYLKDHSPKELKDRLKRQPLSFKDFSPKIPKDVDLFLPDLFKDEAFANSPNVRSEFRSAVPAYKSIETYDILPESFYQESVVMGGTTLEKVRVNPKAIDDPYNALKAYYNGKLEFHLTPAEKFWVGKSEVSFFTRSSDILRFGGIFNELPEVTIDEETLLKIRDAVQDDLRHLKEFKGGLTDSEFVKMAKVAGKLKEKLKKDFPKRDFQKLAKFLAQMGILEVMYKKNIPMSSLYPKITEAFLGRTAQVEEMKRMIGSLKQEGISIRDIARLDAVFGLGRENAVERLTSADRVDWFKQLLPEVKSMEELEEILKIYIGPSPSNPLLPSFEAERLLKSDALNAKVRELSSGKKAQLQVLDKWSHSLIKIKPGLVECVRAFMR